MPEPLNISLKLPTPETKWTLHILRSRSKDLAPRNIALKLVADDKSQPDKSVFDDASENKKVKRISKAERQLRRSEIPKIPVKPPVPTTHVDLTSEDTP